nr:hypothetical protein [uncultured Flavobacterium sp.]
MKTPSVQIYDAKPSKKNPNAKYIVKYVGKNGEPLSQSESLNDIKAVKTHLKAMFNCVYEGALSFEQGLARTPIDYTKEQKFAKSGFASPKPVKK